MNKTKRQQKKILTLYHVRFGDNHKGFKTLESAIKFLVNAVLHRGYSWSLAKEQSKSKFYEYSYTPLVHFISEEDCGFSYRKCYTLSKRNRTYLMSKGVW